MQCKHKTKKEIYIRFRTDKYKNEMRIENLERRAQRISVKGTLKLNRFALQRDVQQRVHALRFVILASCLRSFVRTSLLRIPMLMTRSYTLSFRLPCTRRFMSHSEANGSAAFCAKRETSANHKSREGEIYSVLPVYCSSSSHLH